MSNLISIAGGGTSASTASGARTNLGLGSMAVQDASNVSISGGTLAGDGSGLTTLNASNLASGTVPQARKWTSATITSTGNQDDVSFSGADELRCNNSSLLTIRGLAAGVAGQRLRIISVGSGQVDLAHQNTNSSATNRLINFATSASTSLAAGVGVAEYEYDGTTQRWRLASHEQGAFISVAYSAGDFTGSGSMTWTVDSGDVAHFAYLLRGRILFIRLRLASTSVGGTLSNQLRAALPGGFVNAAVMAQPFWYRDAGGTGAAGLAFSGGSTTLIELGKFDGANWSTATNSTQVSVNTFVEVT